MCDCVHARSCVTPTTLTIIKTDITQYDSWKAVAKWCEDLDDDCCIMIAGNKCMGVHAKKQHMT